MACLAIVPFGKRKFDVAHQAIRPEGQVALCLGGERQHALDQFSSKSSFGGRRNGDAGFIPIKNKQRLFFILSDLPGDRKRARRLPECAVFQRIGCQFMNGEAKYLENLKGQR